MAVDDGMRHAVYHTPDLVIARYFACSKTCQRQLGVEEDRTLMAAHFWFGGDHSDSSCQPDPRSSMIDLKRHLQVQHPNEKLNVYNSKIARIPLLVFVQAANMQS